jgi:hypothetical protein
VRHGLENRVLKCCLFSITGSGGSYWLLLISLMQPVSTKNNSGNWWLRSGTPSGGGFNLEDLVAAEAAVYDCSVRALCRSGRGLADLGQPEFGINFSASLIYSGRSLLAITELVRQAKATRPAGTAIIDYDWKTLNGGFGAIA